MAITISSSTRLNPVRLRIDFPRVAHRLLIYNYDNTFTFFEWPVGNRPNCLIHPPFCCEISVTLPCCFWAVVPILPVLPTLVAVILAVLVALMSAVFSLRHPQTVYRLAVFLWSQKLALLVIIALAVVGFRATKILIGDSPESHNPIANEHRWTMDRGNLLRHGRSPGSRDPVTRNTMWEFQPRGTTFVSSPTVVADQVFLVGSRNDRGTIFCLDAESGKLNWSCRPEGYRATFSSPVVDRGLLFVGEGFHHVRTGRLVCIDLQTEPGRVCWTFATNGHVECTPVVVDDRVYFGAGDDGVYCLRLPEDARGNPEMLWHVSGPEYADVETSLAVHQGRVYVGLGIGGEALVVLDADTGQERARLTVPYPVFSPPAIDGDKLYVGMGVGDYITASATPEGQVCCVDLATWQIDWKYSIPGTVLGAISVVPNGLAFGASDGKVYRLARDGTLLDTCEFAAPIHASLAIGQDRLYAVTDDGHLHCLTIEGLQPIWTLPLAATGHCIASPVLAHSSIFVATEMGGLLRIGSSEHVPQLDSWYGPGGRPGAVGCDAESRLGSEGVLIWSRPISDVLDGGEWVLSGPMARAGGLLVLPVQKRQTPALVALDISTSSNSLPSGSLQWRTDTAGRITTSPVISGGRIAICCQPGDAQPTVLQCLNLSDGTILWQQTLTDTADPTLSLQARRTHVLLADAQGILVAADNGPIWCLDWDGRRQAVVSCGSVQQAVLATPVMLVTATRDPTRLIAFDRPTGTPLWEVSLPHPVPVGMVPRSDSLILGTKAGLERRSLIDGQILAAADDAGGVASEIWCDGVDVLYSDGQQKLVWRSLPSLSLMPTPAVVAPSTAPLVAADGVVFTETRPEPVDGHRLFRVNRSRPDSITPWYTLPADQTITGPMLLTGDYLFLVTNGRHVYCLAGHP